MRSIPKLNDYAGLIVVGMFTGFGNAVGSYLANKHAAKHMDAMTSKIGELTEAIKK